MERVSSHGSVPYGAGRNRVRLKLFRNEKCGVAVQLCPKAGNGTKLGPLARFASRRDQPKPQPARSARPGRPGQSRSGQSTDI